jgi:phosphoribosylanthranilate isomerase
MIHLGSSVSICGSILKNFRVKICCIADEQEAALAISLGASAIGLVGKMPSGPGPISDEQIYRITKTVPPPIATFLLTSEQTPQGIVDHHTRTQTNTIQIVDELTNRDYSALRHALPGTKLVQVIHVTSENSVDEAAELAEHVDAVLLDSGKPSLAVKELGGTGRRHDWRLSRKIVDTCGKPVFLAGGLNSGNIREAIDTVQPFGLDLCSGVRTDGRLDPAKLEAFFNAIG